MVDKIDIGWHNAALTRELQEWLTSTIPSDDKAIKTKPPGVCGIRVVHTNIDALGEDGKFSDHSYEKNKEWKSAITEFSPALAVGTITGLNVDTGEVTVIWDCGAERQYTYEEWKHLIVYSLGPAGYLGQMVFCDQCLKPSVGLAFRLARKNETVGDLYDLCAHCYNEQADKYGESCFYCNVPGNQQIVDRKVPRQTSTKYSLLGIFEDAFVECQKDPDSDSMATVTGKVHNIVHEEGIYNLGSPTYHDSCAEVNLVTSDSDKPELVYRKAGSGGRVELRAIKPGKAPFEVPIEHYPTLDDDIVREVFMCKSKFLRLKESEYCHCFIRCRPDQTCYSLTISGSKLQNITQSEIGEQCKEFKMVILLCFNQLYSMPNIINSFENLTEIIVNKNFLTRLPPSFAELKQLQSVDLTDNAFTCIPAPLLLLPKLKSIHLTYNRIQRLAPIEDKNGEETLALLKRLVTLRLRGNPILKHLKDYPNTSLATLRAHFHELHQIPVSKALRVLVLGSSSAGKTSIVRALSFEKYVAPEAPHEHTIGINRFSVPVQMKNNKGEDLIIELRFWDFAGERSYVMMNNLFVTKGTLIWIAVNFETYKCTNASFHEHVASWIQQVITSSVRPVIWVIGTHADKCDPEDIRDKIEHIRERIERECDVFSDKLKEELKNVTDDDESSEHSQHRSKFCLQKTKQELEKLIDSNVPQFIKSHLKVISLTNTKRLEGLDTLQTCIENIDTTEKAFSWLNDPLTIKQQKVIDKLRQRIEQMLDKEQVPVIDSFEFLAEMNSLSEEEAKSLRKYLFQVGAVLKCHPRKELSDYKVILDVEWLINLLKQIFHHDFERMMNEKKRKGVLEKWGNESIKKEIQWQQTFGIVSIKLLDALWNLKKQTKDELVGFLETVGLVHHLKDTEEYMFPWLVTKECPSDFIPPIRVSGEIPPHVSDREKHILISYEFSPCLPICFIQELAVRCHTELVHVSIGAIYKNGFVIHTTVNSVDISIHALALPEVDNMGGKIYLSATTTSPSSDLEMSKLAFNLWQGLLAVIWVMENMVCFWIFYSNLNRKIYCTQCNSQPFDFQLKLKIAMTAPQPSYCCETHKMLAPPGELLVKVNEYFDRKLKTSIQRRSTLIPGTVGQPAPKLSSSIQTLPRTVSQPVMSTETAEQAMARGCPVLLTAPKLSTSVYLRHRSPNSDITFHFSPPQSPSNQQVVPSGENNVPDQPPEPPSTNYTADEASFHTKYENDSLNKE